MPKPIIKHAKLPWLDPNKEITPTAVILHWWGEPINEKGVKWLIELLGRRELSVQFAVLASGEIYQLSPKPHTWCRHAKCANNNSIGIEIEGLNEHDLDTNQKQFDAVVSLTGWLKDEYSIQQDFRVEHEGDDDAVRFFGITNHKTVDPHCSNANGKVDVHDEYVTRVKEAVSKGVFPEGTSKNEIDLAQIAAKNGHLNEWILRFLSSEKEVQLKEFLASHSFALRGPELVSLGLMQRTIGPEADMLNYETTDDFEAKIAQRNKDMKSAPIIAEEQDRHFVICDGSHRYEALKRAGFKQWWVVYWSDQHMHSEVAEKLQEAKARE